MDVTSSAEIANAKHTCDSNPPRPSGVGRVSLFWDESFLWGLIAFKTFLRLRINFDLITSADIREGILDTYDVLFVPGGWASNKVVALGELGKEHTRRFIKEGGSYLGFCGGAGMALQHDDGISLVPISRKPTSIRVPSFSGKIQLHHELVDHPIWENIPDGAAFHAWWPGQFSIADTGGIKVLASYGDPEKGSFVADLPVSPTTDWDRWERSYGTNLNPNRIKGEPALIEADYGRGKVLLSYLHFETPEDELGHRVLLNMLSYLLKGKAVTSTVASSRDSDITKARSPMSRTGETVTNLTRELEALALDLISFGEEHFLWYWRNSWLIQWRRGVRGIEYCTLYAMLKQLAELSLVLDDLDEAIVKELEEIRELALPFFEEAKQLLTSERYAMNYRPLSPLKSDDEQIQRMRKRLFSNSKRFGGHYKQIIDRIDDLLLPLLISAKNRSVPTLPHA